MNNNLQKEDYEEPRCLLNMHPEIVRIPVQRVIEKLDEYLRYNDYDSAERHLKYWLAEAEAGNDDRGKLTVLNEQIGLFRKMSKEEECMKAIELTMELAASPELESTVTLGTTYINAATGYKAFGKTEKALPLYLKAKQIYEAVLDDKNALLGGLYNNMALALAADGQFARAREFFDKAIAVMSAQENGESETAITWLNIADLIINEKGAWEGAAEAETCLDKAEALLDTPTIPRNGNYAFVCEKCAPVFGYYGRFVFEKELEKRAKDIYEGN